MVHPNDEAHLRELLILKTSDPWPPSFPELYARYRYFSERQGTGTMPFPTMHALCIAVQDAELAANRPAPAMPPQKTRTIPQHQLTPKSVAEKQKAAPERAAKEAVKA